MIKKILSFFAGRTETTFDQDDLRDMRPYQIGDNPHTINRKKTATQQKLISNTYEPDTRIRGQIICVTSDNRSTGYSHSIHSGITTLGKQITTSLSHNPNNHCDIIITQIIPTRAQLMRKKTIVISDFFWSDRETTIFLEQCKRGLAHGLIIPLMTLEGNFVHPLQEKYPQWFWSLEV